MKRKEIVNLIRRWGNRCTACATSTEVLCLDHVIPLSKGGNDSVENLQILCISCNSQKSNRIADFRIFHPESFSWWRWKTKKKDGRKRFDEKLKRQAIAMKRGLFLLTLITLIGCEKKNVSSLLGTPTTPNYAQTLFIGAGQSNMASEDLSQTFPANKNVAVGGSNLSQWQRGTPNYQTLKEAIGTQDAVILWWQGESEGLYGFTGQFNAYYWAGNFMQMVHDLRQDTGKRLEFIYVQIGTTTLPAAAWEVVKAQQSLVERDMPYLHMVRIDGMNPEGDGQIHYSQAQYKIVQQKMLQSYLDNFN